MVYNWTRGGGVSILLQEDTIVVHVMVDGSNQRKTFAMLGDPTVFVTLL